MATDLDPADWPSFRTQAHRMLDDALDYVEHIRERPVWQPIPAEVRDRFRDPVPRAPSDLAAVHGKFLNDILPYATGNTHPGFMGWVHGGGTPVGMLAEMLAASLNANLGGRDHIPIEVERQIVRWMQTIFGFPESATGLFVTGSFDGESHRRADRPRCGFGFRSALRGRRREFPQADRLRLGGRSHLHCPGHGFLRDRQRCAPSDSRPSWPRDGSGGTGKGHRGGSPRRVSRRSCWSARPAAWIPAPLTISARWPIFRAASISGSTSTEPVGRWPYWRRISLRVCSGIERADSLAFDFHKWGQVPYDAGFILVRDGVLHRKTFATSAAYLRREERGLAGGSPWPCDFGPDLSRGFRALKTWFTLKVYGADALGAAISRTCELARYLESRIKETPELELLAPVRAEHRLFPLSRRR